MTRDEKAKAAHDIWAHWMKYMFSLCVNTGGDIDAQIPKEKIKQWQRLMNTEFEDLTEQEKKSDYEIADKYLM